LLRPTEPSLEVALALCERELGRRAPRWRWARLLLPRAARPDLVALLAWHRLARELGGADRDEFSRRRALGELRRELGAALAGVSRTAVGVALGARHRRHRLPARQLAATLRALERDARVGVFDTREELAAHAAALAAPEGRLILHALGVAGERARVLADSASAAIQLTRWTTHLPAELACGRLRLAAEDLRREGVDVARIAERPAAPELRRAVARQIAWTRGLYAKSWPLCRELGPWRGRLAAFVLRWNAASLAAIEARGHDVTAGPPRAGWPRIAACAALALAGRAAPRLAPAGTLAPPAPPLRRPG
jgi:phytoene synthase